MCLCLQGLNEKEKKERVCGERKFGGKGGRKKGGREGEMWACLIQCPVVVTCPSAPSIGRKRGREGWRGRERIEIQPPPLTTQSQEPEASATSGNFLHRQAMERKTCFYSLFFFLDRLCSTPSQPLISTSMHLVGNQIHSNTHTCIQLMHTHRHTL